MRDATVIVLALAAFLGACTAMERSWYRCDQWPGNSTATEFGRHCSAIEARRAGNAR